MLRPVLGTRAPTLSLGMGRRRSQQAGGQGACKHGASCHVATQSSSSLVVSCTAAANYWIDGVDSSIRPCPSTSSNKLPGSTALSDCKPDTGYTTAPCANKNKSSRVIAAALLSDCKATIDHSTTALH